jgi:hypothetical protein
VNNVAYGTGCNRSSATQCMLGLVKEFDSLQGIGSEVALVFLETMFNSVQNRAPFQTEKSGLPKPPPKNFFRDALGDVLKALGKTFDDLDSVVLVGHSHAYDPIGAALQRGGADQYISAVVFIDSLFEPLTGPLNTWRGARGSAGVDARIVYTAERSGKGGTDKNSIAAAGLLGSPPALLSKLSHKQSPDACFTELVAAVLGGKPPDGSVPCQGPAGARVDKKGCWKARAP